MKAIVKRLAFALWPLLFLPLVLAALKSGKLGQYDHLVFRIDEPMIIAVSVYIVAYCGFWLWGKEHGMSAIFSAMVTVCGIGFWQYLAPTIDRLQ